MAEYTPTPTGIARQELIESLKKLRGQIHSDIRGKMTGVYYALNDKSLEVQQMMSWMGGLDLAIEIVEGYFNQLQANKNPDE